MGIINFTASKQHENYWCFLFFDPPKKQNIYYFWNLFNFFLIKDDSIPNIQHLCYNIHDSIMEFNDTIVFICCLTTWSWII